MIFRTPRYGEPAGTFWHLVQLPSSVLCAKPVPSHLVPSRPVRQFCPVPSRRLLYWLPSSQVPLPGHRSDPIPPVRPLGHSFMPSLSPFFLFSRRFSLLIFPPFSSPLLSSSLLSHFHSSLLSIPLSFPLHSSPTTAFLPAAALSTEMSSDCPLCCDKRAARMTSPLLAEIKKNQKAAAL